MNKQYFKVGDKVNYYPYGDRVFELVEHHNPVDYTLLIIELGISFTPEGKEFKDHALPMLTLIERKSENEEWYQVFYKLKTCDHGHRRSYLYKSKEQFLVYINKPESDFEFIVFKKVDMESDL